MKTKINNKNKIAHLVGKALNATLFVSANTNSSIMIHQPKAPKGIERFKREK